MREVHTIGWSTWTILFVVVLLVLLAGWFYLADLRARRSRRRM